MPRGGKREGAGRPCANTVPVKVRLTERQKAFFQSLGGSKWLQQQLNEEETKMTKFENLSRGARRIIEGLFGDGPITRGAALAALEDGEYLAKIGATEKAVGEAYEYLEGLPIGRDAELSLYEIRGAIAAADAFDYSDEEIEQKLWDCYEDSDLGLFPADAVAVAAADDRQMADDAKAEKIGLEALGKEFALSGGPVYRDHIGKWTAVGLEPVEL